MATYGDMQSRIATELKRSDLTSPIRSAILSAVLHYERQRFSFNETSGTFSTVASQEWYTSANFAPLATAPALDALIIAIDGGTRYPLRRRSLAELDDWSTSTTVTGDPTDYAVHHQALRLYPIPDAVRTITVYYVQRLTALSADADSNVWTNDGEELIRCRARADVLINLIEHSEAVQEFELLAGQGQPFLSLQERVAYQALRREGDVRAMGGGLRPTSF